MEAKGIPESRWFDARARGQGEPRPADQPPGHGLHGPCAELADPPARPQEGDGAARPAGRDRSLSDGLGGAARPQGQHLPAAGRDPVRDLRLGDRVQPLAAVAREGDRADVRVQARSHDPLSAGAEVRLRRADVQAHPGQRRGAAGRGHHPRVQPRRLDHRLYRPVARAAAPAHGQPAHLRQDHAAGQRRPVRRRVLRHAVAVLGHARR